MVFGAKKSVLFRGTSGQARFRLQPAVNSRGMAMTVERISAVTFRVSNMQASVQFYRDVLGMEMLYGGERSSFSSLRAGNADSAILNLELGEAATRWGRLIFYVADVDGAWKHFDRPEIQAGAAARRPVGRAILPHARPGRPRAVVRAAASMNWKYPIG